MAAGEATRPLRAVDANERRCPALSEVHQRECELLAGHAGPHRCRHTWYLSGVYEWRTGREDLS